MANQLSFLNCKLDTARNELRRDGDLIELEPQVFDLIVFMATNAGRVLSKDDLIDGVWSGRIVSDSAISSRINAARNALGDNGKDQAIIKTVSRKGFIFVPELDAPTQPKAQGNHAQPSAVNSSTEAPHGGKPSIVVLPFENLSNDPSQTFFSDGIADDIITDLSRYNELFVIARHSAFAYHDRKDHALDFANKLGVKYLLQGAVRRSENRIRVSAQLVDLDTQTTLWAEKYNRNVEDILDVQEEISTVIVNTLVGQVELRHAKAAELRSETAISAYDHCLRAQHHIWNFSREQAALARKEAQAAIALEPNLARAHAILGWAYHTEGSNGWHEKGEARFDMATECAKQAIAADPNEPWGHCVLGFCLWWHPKNRNFSVAIEVLKVALRLNPSNAHFRMILGATYAYMGEGEAALDEINTAISHNPFYPSLYLVHRARAFFVSERYKEAMADIDRAAIDMPDHSNVIALKAACCEQLGLHDDAQEAVKTLNEFSPEYTLAFVRRTIPFARDQDLNQFCDLLKAAGLPEE